MRKSDAIVAALNGTDTTAEKNQEIAKAMTDLKSAVENLTGFVVTCPASEVATQRLRDAVTKFEGITPFPANVPLMVQTGPEAPPPAGVNDEGPSTEETPQMVAADQDNQPDPGNGIASNTFEPTVVRNPNPVGPAPAVPVDVGPSGAPNAPIEGVGKSVTLKDSEIRAQVLGATA